MRDYTTLIVLLVLIALWTIEAIAHDPCEPDVFNPSTRQCEPVTPPPPGGACPEQPVWRSQVGPGGPYYECGGFEAAIRIDQPATLGFHISHVMQASEGSACIMEWTNWNNVQNDYNHELPDVVVTANRDIIYYNRGTVPGRVIFDGRGGQSAQRIHWINTDGMGSAEGYECRNGARNIEVDGQCICP